MPKFNELSLSDRQCLIDDISFVMHRHYNIDNESIKMFWSYVEIGIEKERVA